MHCQRCGSTQFEEENGVYFCTICQTQTQGFAQESEETFVDRSKFFAKEIYTSRRKSRVKAKKASALWTTTEAFNIILMKQMHDILQMNASRMDASDFGRTTRLVWFAYLRKADLSFTDYESADSETITRRLHPASRFRDVQILTNKVDDVLPKFKSGSTPKGFVEVFRLGSDGVLRNVEELDELSDYKRPKSRKEMDYDMNDIFYQRFGDFRDHSKNKSYERKISKETQKQLKKILSKIDLNESLEETIHLSQKELNREYKSRDCIDSDSDEEIDGSKHVTTPELRDDERSELMGEELSESKDNESIISDENWFETDDKYEEKDKELLRNLPKSMRMFAKLLPLSFLKKSRNIRTDYFIDLMSLPKTLAILNIVMRLLKYDIYCSDLIRWAHEGHIPYQNCLTCMPEDWLFISNDFHTFTSTHVPTYAAINRLSARIAGYIEMKTFPRPDLRALVARFAKDLNLPEEIVAIIEDDYNLYEHFSESLERTAMNCRKISTFPYYERWALMAIVLVLKKIFILNDSTEKRLSDCDLKDFFNWSEWEQYSRVRLDMIYSYTCSLYTGDFERIRDQRLIAEYSLKRSEYEMSRMIECIKKKNDWKEFDFRTDMQHEFTALLYHMTDSGSPEFVKHSLYPLTTATELALNLNKCSSVSEVLSTSFEHKRLIGWTCPHGKVFHRGYDCLARDPKRWSSSFKLLIQLSCVLLRCKTQELIPILFKMEKIYFIKQIAKTKR